MNEHEDIKFNIFTLSNNNNNNNVHISEESDDSNIDSNIDTEDVINNFDNILTDSNNSDNSNDYYGYDYDSDHNYNNNKNKNKRIKETKNKKGKRQKLSNAKYKNKGKVHNSGSSSISDSKYEPLSINGSMSSSIPDSSSSESSNKNYVKKKSKNKNRIISLFKNNSKSYDSNDNTSASSISSNDNDDSNVSKKKRKQYKNNEKLKQQHSVFAYRTILNTQKNKKNEKKLEVVKLNEFSKLVRGMKQKIEENKDVYPKVAKIYEDYLKGWQKKAVSSDGIFNSDPNKLLHVPYSYSRHIEFENGMNDQITEMGININDVAGCFGCNTMAFFNHIIRDIQTIEQTKNLTFLLLKALENSSVITFYHLVPNIVETYCRAKFKKKTSNIEWNVVEVYIHFNFHMSNFCTVFKLKKEIEKLIEFKCYLESKLATLNVTHIDMTNYEKSYLSQPQKDNNTLYFKYDEVIEKKEKQFKDELNNLYSLYKNNEDTILNSSLKNDREKHQFHEMCSEFLINF